MRNIQDEFNINSNSIFNSFDKLKIYESPISASFDNAQNIPSNSFLPPRLQTPDINFNPTNKNQLGEINSITKDINNLSTQHIEFPVSKEDYLNNLFNETKMLQTEINEKKSKLIRENEDIQEKKKKLIDVYYNLYEFRNRLLDKERELNDKEYNLTEYENVLKNNENILKNNIDNFDEYIKNKSNELKNQFEQIQKLQNKKEDELRQREEQLIKMIEMYSLNKDLNNINNNLNNLNQNDIIQNEQYKLNNNLDTINKDIIQKLNDFESIENSINTNKIYEKNKNINNLKISESIDNNEFINFFNNYTLGNYNQNTEMSNNDKKEEVKENDIDNVNIEELDSKIKSLLLKENI